jgi:hypothetical protein
MLLGDMALMILPVIIISPVSVAVKLKSLHSSHTSPVLFSPLAKEYPIGPLKLEEIY